ncbi:MAG: pantetheine-phosphate adenylyltransferase [Acidimicrobiia bacterium]
MTTAMCPGSFDPPTNGHIDIIRRCSAIYERVIVAVVSNPSKNSMFTLGERIELLGASLDDLDNIDLMSFDGLLVDFASEQEVDVVVKGLRAGSDFDYELQMSQMNSHLRGMETVFMPTSPDWSFVSSSLVREVARLGGSVGDLVPPPVATALEEKLA